MEAILNQLCRLCCSHISHGQNLRQKIEPFEVVSVDRLAGVNRLNQSSRIWTELTTLQASCAGGDL